ncbi:MAG: hypothetical protein ACOC4C_04520 [Fibrobacterota bacterium]
MEKEIFRNNNSLPAPHAGSKSRRKQIPFLKGRPKRNTTIGDDDLTNLRIALNTAKTLDEFIIDC